MSIDATVAVLYAQTGLASSMTNAAVIAPQASAAMSRMMAAEMARQEQQQVVKAESGGKMSLSPDGQGRGGKPFGSRRRHRPAHAGNEEEAAPPLSPLLGNLLNINV